MSRMTDAIESLERDLRRYPGDGEDDLLNRRYCLRTAFDAWGCSRYEEGHADGIRDVLDTQREAKRRADQAAGQETKPLEVSDV